jgi:hypothetical protein
MSAVLWCVRLTPLVAAAVVVLPVTGLGGGFGLPEIPVPGDLGSTLSAVVAQFFAWTFLLVALAAVGRFLSIMVAEFRLRRLYDRADHTERAAVRAERAVARLHPRPGRPL